MAYCVDAVVIGAGAIGLAVARALSQSGRDVVVLEKEPIVGSGTSSRSSEVVHAGLYYPQGSLKARLCVAGREALFQYAAERDVGHRRCGKLVVATSPAEQDYLEALESAARANGVEDIQLLSGTQVCALEPGIAAVAGLLSPSTGIVDSHALMLAYQAEAEVGGAMFAYNAPVMGGAFSSGAIELRIGGVEASTLEAQLVVNAAGLGAWEVSSSIVGLDRKTIPPMRLAKGCYFTLAGRCPFTRLIYPVPELGGLGVHLTFDLAGQTRFGPDLQWVERVDFTVDAIRAERFYAAIRRYWPDLRDGVLQPGYAGIRPKVTGPGEPSGDFVVQGPAATGHPGYVALYGIESPGLTASLAIADHVCWLVSGR